MPPQEKMARSGAQRLPRSGSRAAGRGAQGQTTLLCKDKQRRCLRLFNRIFAVCCDSKQIAAIIFNLAPYFLKAAARQDRLLLSYIWDILAHNFSP